MASFFAVEATFHLPVLASTFNKIVHFHGSVVQLFLIHFFDGSSGILHLLKFEESKRILSIFISFDIEMDDLPIYFKQWL